MNLEVYLLRSYYRFDSNSAKPLSLGRFNVLKTKLKVSIDSQKIQGSVPEPSCIVSARINKEQLIVVGGKPSPDGNLVMLAPGKLSIQASLSGVECGILNYIRIKGAHIVSTSHRMILLLKDDELNVKRSGEIKPGPSSTTPKWKLVNSNFMSEPDFREAPYWNHSKSLFFHGGKLYFLNSQRRSVMTISNIDKFVKGDVQKFEVPALVQADVQDFTLALPRKRLITLTTEGLVTDYRLKGPKKSKLPELETSGDKRYCSTICASSQGIVVAYQTRKGYSFKDELSYQLLNRLTLRTEPGGLVQVACSLHLDFPITLTAATCFRVSFIFSCRHVGIFDLMSIHSRKLIPLKMDMKIPFKMPAGSKYAFGAVFDSKSKQFLTPIYDQLLVRFKLTV